jgi:hypothetical protein
LGRKEAAAQREALDKVEVEEKKKTRGERKR